MSEYTNPWTSTERAQHRMLHEHTTDIDRLEYNQQLLLLGCKNFFTSSSFPLVRFWANTVWLLAFEELFLWLERFFHTHIATHFRWMLATAAAPVIRVISPSLLKMGRSNPHWPLGRSSRPSFFRVIILLHPTATRRQLWCSVYYHTIVNSTFSIYFYYYCCYRSNYLNSSILSSLIPRLRRPRSEPPLRCGSVCLMLAADVMPGDDTAAALSSPRLRSAAAAAAQFSSGSGLSKSSSSSSSRNKTEPWRWLDRHRSRWPTKIRTRWRRQRGWAPEHRNKRSSSSGGTDCIKSKRNKQQPSGHSTQPLPFFSSSRLSWLLAAAAAPALKLVLIAMLALTAAAAGAASGTAPLMPMRLLIRYYPTATGVVVNATLRRWIACCGSSSSSNGRRCQCGSLPWATITATRAP